MEASQLEIGPLTGLGVGDLQHAMLAEIKRILRETKGDELAQTKVLHGRLRELGLVEEGELETLDRLAEISFDTTGGLKSAQQAYFESREIYNTMLATGKASPVALVIASSAVGSYTIGESADGSGTVVFAKSNGNWEQRGAAAGAIIGSLWGPGGAVVGAAVGGLVGAAVDQCTK
jgi:hypothetical protein